MKTVVLIGDSIRMSYEATVRSALDRVADIRAPQENGGNSRNVLAHLDEWAIAHQPDVVHFNCGLHDLRRELGQPDPAVPMDEYERNLREILTGLRSRTQATVIWATNTPVNEKWHNRSQASKRFEADVDAYNRAALTVVNTFDVPINDLHTVVMQAGRDTLLAPDGAHFTDDGCTQLGHAVARFISPYLKSD